MPKRWQNLTSFPSYILVSRHIFWDLQKGLKNVFDEAILTALEPPEPKWKEKCVLS